MSDLFRRLFNFRGHRDSNRLFDEDDKNDDATDQDDVGNGLEDMFEHFHGDMQRQMETIQKQMEDMMKGFGVVDFSSAFQMPKIRPGLEPPSEEKFGDNNGKIWSGAISPFFHNFIQKEKRSPRDFMLKDNVDFENHKKISPPEQKSQIVILPQEDNQRLLDTDLDGKISEDKVLDLIKKPNLTKFYDVEQPVQKMPFSFSSSKSFSFSSFRGPNGRVEEQQVVRDSNGCEKKTVTKILGDQSYSVTKVIHPDGKEETKENYHNVDEKNLGQFLDSWTKSNQPSLMPPPQSHPELDSRDKNLFTKLFGPKI